MVNDDLDRRLRQALHEEAERIRPRERRAEILDNAHHSAQSREHRRRWFLPVAAAASVALIGAGVMGLSNSGNSQPAPSAVAPAVTTTSPTTSLSTPTRGAPSPATVTRDRAPATKDPAPTVPWPRGAATAEMALPAYFVGPSSASGGQFGLYREFLTAVVPMRATAAQKVEAALVVAMNPEYYSSQEPYLRPWSGTSVTNVTTMPSRITITLSDPGASGFTAAQTRLAVQQLVWTAQAALGTGTIPVMFVVRNGASELFGTYPTAQTYNRPPKDLQYQVLAPIWITSPGSPGVTRMLPEGQPVVISGQSCAFEGTTQWQLKKDLTLIRSGFTTATSGCPTRGTWQVRLGGLASGHYTFRMYEVSMQDGKGIVAETSKTFMVGTGLG